MELRRKELPLRRMVGRAYYINAEGSAARRAQIEASLRGVLPYERWPAIQGGPHLLATHANYLRRGVEAHLLTPHCRRARRTTASGALPRAAAANCSLANVSSWGMVGNFLSHYTLLERVAASAEPSEAVLIVQDDVRLAADWRARLETALRTLPRWERVLLAWRRARWRVRRARVPGARARRAGRARMALLPRPAGEMQYPVHFHASLAFSHLRCY